MFFFLFFFFLLLPHFRNKVAVGVLPIRRLSPIVVTLWFYVTLTAIRVLSRPRAILSLCSRNRVRVCMCGENRVQSASARAYRPAQSQLQTEELLNIFCPPTLCLELLSYVTQGMLDLPRFHRYKIKKRPAVSGNIEHLVCRARILTRLTSFVISTISILSFINIGSMGRGYTSRNVWKLVIFYYIIF